MGADTETYGWIQTLFATLQLIGNPIFGYFGDVFGPKFTVIVALTSAGLSYMLLGFSTNLTMLVISRFPAIAMHGYTGIVKVLVVGGVMKVKLMVGKEYDKDSHTCGYKF